MKTKLFALITTIAFIIALVAFPVSASDYYLTQGNSTVSDDGTTVTLSTDIAPANGVWRVQYGSSYVMTANAASIVVPSTYSGGAVQYHVFGGTASHWDGLSLSGLPAGSYLTWTPTLSVTPTSGLSSDVVRVFLYYYDADGNSLTYDAVTFSGGSTGFTIRSVPNAVSVGLILRYSGVSFTSNTTFRISKSTLTVAMPSTAYSSYTQQSFWDSVLETPVDPAEPDNSDVVTDLENLENDLLADTSDGLDQYNDMTAQALVDISQIGAALMFLASVFNNCFTVSQPFYILFTISLSLGVCAYVFNLLSTALRKKGDD